MEMVAGERRAFVESRVQHFGFREIRNNENANASCWRRTQANARLYRPLTSTPNISDRLPSMIFFLYPTQDGFSTTATIGGSPPSSGLCMPAPRWNTSVWLTAHGSDRSQCCVSLGAGGPGFSRRCGASDLAAR